MDYARGSGLWYWRGHTLTASDIHNFGSERGQVFTHAYAHTFDTVIIDHRVGDNGQIKPSHSSHCSPGHVVIPFYKVEIVGLNPAPCESMWSDGGSRGVAGRSEGGGPASERDSNLTTSIYLNQRVEVGVEQPSSENRSTPSHAVETISQEPSLDSSTMRSTGGSSSSHPGLGQGGSTSACPNLPIVLTKVRARTGASTGPHAPESYIPTS